MNDRAHYPDYRHLREVLAPELAILPAETLRAEVDEAFGEGAADAYEAELADIFQDLGRTFRSATRAVGRAMPAVAREVSRALPKVAKVGAGVVQGATAGSALGLPGIVAGAATGGVGAGLGAFGRGAARRIGGALSGVTQLAGQLTPMGRAGAAVGGALGSLAGSRGGRGAGGAATAALNGLLSLAGGLGGPAGQIAGGAARLLGSGGGAAGGRGLDPGALAALGGLFGGTSALPQLGSLLGRRETAQALAALRLGPLGRRTVPVGSARTPVPSAVFPQIIAQLAQEAATEAAEWSGDGESALAYMVDADGESVGDPALERDRVARAWDLLNEAQAERVLGAIANRWGEGEPVPERWDGSDPDTLFYDALDAAEADEIEAALEAASFGAAFELDEAYHAR